MTITVSFGEILDHGLWDDFCELKGLNPWILNEGMASDTETVTLTLEEAKKIGLTIPSGSST